MKQGYGKHRMRVSGEVVTLVPGSTVQCEPEELGGAIDKFDALTEPTKTPTTELLVAQTEDGYFVATAEGKAIHQGAISHEEAVNLAGESEVVAAEVYYQEFGGLEKVETEEAETTEPTKEPTKPSKKKGKKRR
jgi:hypothetical protein